MIDTIYTSFGTIIGTLIILFLCFLAILWFLLPVFIYEIKKSMHTLVFEVKQLRKCLSVQIEQQLDYTKHDILLKEPTPPKTFTKADVNNGMSE